MPSDHTNQKGRTLDLAVIDFLPIFEKFDEGVIIVDHQGVIVFYNETMAKIDELEAAAQHNKRVTEIYDLTDETSMIMQCLQKGRPLINRPLYYRTRRGRVANTIHNVFPLYQAGRLMGAICFVKDYKLVEETIAAIALQRKGRQPHTEARYTFTDIIGDDADFDQCIRTARMASGSPSPVMLCGETGTGKELFAQSIHNHSQRRRRRYIPVNCTAIPENLLEGILFGTTKGAFTGALDKPGLFERANGGTLFLDEVNSMPIGLQAKILRVLQEQKVRRVGSLREIDIDIKIISSLNQEPHRAIADQRLRPDLFYRLGVVYIALPPLRVRRGDIPALVSHFLEKLGRSLGKQVSGVSENVMARFLSYAWPGNVRELEHVLEGALNMAWDQELITADQLRSHFYYGPETRLPEQGEGAAPVLPNSDGSAAAILPVPPHPLAGRPDAGGEPLPEGQTLMQTQQARELQAIRQAMARQRGNVTRAAANLGISRQLLHYKLRKYGLDRRQFRV